MQKNENKLLTYRIFYGILLIPLRIPFFRVFLLSVLREVQKQGRYHFYKKTRKRYIKKSNQLLFLFSNRSFFMYFIHNQLQILLGGAENMASDVRIKVTLACTECKQRNYDTTKNKRNDPDRLELNKYCKFCRKHTLHKETK